MASTTAATPEAVATAYFDAIRSRDVDAIRALFAGEATLVTAAGAVEGPDEIAVFYEQTAFAFDDLEPRPDDLIVDGDRVAVEIELQMAGTVMAVADFFTIRDGLIERLVVYMVPS